MRKEIYIVVRGKASNIEQLVNDKIKEGYVPIGGISTYFSSGYADYSQAMILKEYA